MSDLTDRLRRWAISTDAVPASDLMEEAADEVERLRSAYAAAIHRLADEIPRLRSQPCPYVTGDTTRYCTLTPLTLTDAEREAVEQVIDAANGKATADPWAYATLRSLLERLGVTKPMPKENLA